MLEATKEMLLFMSEKSQLLLSVYGTRQTVLREDKGRGIRLPPASRPATPVDY